MINTSGLPSRGPQATEIQWESAPSFSGIIATQWCAGTGTSRTALQALNFEACYVWSPWIGIEFPAWPLVNSAFAFPLRSRNQISVTNRAHRILTQEKSGERLWLPYNLNASEHTPGQFQLNIRGLNWPSVTLAEANIWGCSISETPNLFLTSYRDASEEDRQTANIAMFMCDICLVQYKLLCGTISNKR